MIVLPTRIDLFKLEKPGSIGAEIGVWRGYLSSEILNKTKIGKLYLVDAWVPQPGYNDPLTDTDHEENLRLTKHHLRGHPDRYQIVRGSSVEMAASPEVPMLDFAYIDADHSFGACLADLNAWENKIKPGGVLMGHDFTMNHQAHKWNFGVIAAVAEFCKKNGWVLTHLTNEDFSSYRLERL